MSDGDKLAESVAAWVSRAEEDFRTLNILLKDHDPPWGSVAFNAQQCAEKYLKALLLWRGIEFPKTHDLAKLLTLFPETPPVDWSPRDTAALSDQAVAPRYPDEFEPTGEEEAREMVRPGGRCTRAPSQSAAARSAEVISQWNLGIKSPRRVRSLPPIRSSLAANRSAGWDEAEMENGVAPKLLTFFTSDREI